jgi:phosphoglycerate dehydrogenase-like enzyme
MDAIKLLVLANPSAPHLRVLERLPDQVNILAGNDPEFVRAHAVDADVILSAGVKGDLLRDAFPLARKVRWVHALWTGVEKVLFPELIASPVPLTNGRGVF